MKKKVKNLGYIAQAILMVCWPPLILFIASQLLK